MSESARPDPTQIIPVVVNDHFAFFTSESGDRYMIGPFRDHNEEAILAARNLIMERFGEEIHEGYQHDCFQWLTLPIGSPATCQLIQ